MVAIGLVVLWPGKVDAELSQGLTAPTERAEVRSVETAPCPPPQPGTCGTAQISLESGPDEGTEATLAIGGVGLAPELEEGDRLRVTRTIAPDGGEPVYSLTDYERRTPLFVLALVFAALVVLLGRLRGALSLVGLAISLVVIVAFVAPAILDGSSPLAVSIVGSLAVMLATIRLLTGLVRRASRRCSGPRRACS